MVVIEQTPDGRWWISQYGWGRPIGTKLDGALEAANHYYPGQRSIVKQRNPRVASRR